MEAVADTSTSYLPPPASRLQPAASASDAGAPRIVAAERLIEAKDVVEVVERIVRLTQQHPEVHQREHDVPDIRGRTDSPMLENEARHHPEALERQIPAARRQFLSRDMAAFIETLLAIL